MLTHHNLLFSAKHTGRNSRSMTADDVQYCVLPILAHRWHLPADDDVDGWRGDPPLVAKGDPTALAKALAKKALRYLDGVPATFQRLLEIQADRRVCRKLNAARCA